MASMFLSCSANCYLLRQEDTKSRGFFFYPGLSVLMALPTSAKGGLTPQRDHCKRAVLFLSPSKILTPHPPLPLRVRPPPATQGGGGGTHSPGGEGKMRLREIGLASYSNNLSTTYPLGAQNITLLKLMFGELVHRMSQDPPPHLDVEDQGGVGLSPQVHHGKGRQQSLQQY